MRARRSAPVRDMAARAPRVDQRFSTIVRCALLELPPPLAVTLILAIDVFFFATAFFSALSAFFGIASLMVVLPAFERCFFTVLKLYALAAFGTLSVPPALRSHGPVQETVTRTLLCCFSGFCLPLPASVSSLEMIVPGVTPGPPGPPGPPAI